MKQFLHAVLTVALVLVAATSAPSSPPAASVFPNLQNDPLFDQETYQALRDITVDVSWNRAPLGTVLRDLTLMVRKTYPIAATINFRLSSTAPPTDRQWPISLAVKGGSIYELLENLGQQTGCTIRVHHGLVLIMPQATLPPHNSQPEVP
jgi:hypothetical protein